MLSEDANVAQASEASVWSEIRAVRTRRSARKLAVRQPPGYAAFGIEPLWAGQRRRGSHPCGPEIGRSSSTSAMARSPVPLCRDEDINTRQESRVVSESLPLGQIFLRPADGIPLHVIGFIEAIEDGARTAPAYTATLRAFGLGKERPMAPRILVWCWSGRGRWA